MLNSTKNKAIGESLDITNAIPTNSHITITGTDDYQLIRGSKVVAITASKGKITTSRTDLLANNISLIKKIVPKIKKYADDSKIVIVTNPLDVITYVATKETGFSREQVIGMGSSLDSNRFRYLLAKALEVNQSKITGLVIGEHGDSMVPIFSSATCDGKPVVGELDKTRISGITSELRNYWKILKTFKDASVFGAARNTFDIVKTIVKNERLEVPASVLLDGEYGLSDICVGVPLSISDDIKINEISLTKSERKSLYRSAAIVRENIIGVQKN